MAFANRLRCYICDNAFAPRVMSRIFGEERMEIREIAIPRRDEFERPPLIVEPDTRICANCYQSILREIRIIQENPMSVRLNVLRQTRNNSCFICNRANNLLRLSNKCKAKVFIDCNIFFPETVRSCNQHLDDRGYILSHLLPGLQYINRQYVIPGPFLQLFLREMRQVSLDSRILHDVNDLSDEDMYYLTALTKEQFNELFDYCDRVPCVGGYRYVKRSDLLMFLCKLRQGLSDQFLTIIFNYSSRQATSLAIATVRESLMNRFVAENIGLNTINRDQYIRRHVTEFANVLYNEQPDNPVAIVYIDGTYSYCQKSSNFRALRQSFCVHKGRHLIKPALMVAPDGFILDIHGPYFSDSQNNDAAILRNEFENEEDINDWFQAGDIAIIDRGYRDILPTLENFGLRCRMPPLLEQGQRQFSTEEANESRLITKTRWIVEARNGHLKTKFKLLSNIQQIHVLPNVGDIYRISGAIINRFHPLIFMANANGAVAQQMRERSLLRNNVQARVENENLGARDAQRWIRLDAEELCGFPVLTIDYLKDLTFGIYQIELAPSYVQDKLQREDTDEFQVEMLQNENRLPEPGFLRVRLFSRFRNRTRYQLWVSYLPNEHVNNEPIRGYYCTCKTGARTLGTCVHITSVLWYLGFARHEENVHYPSHALIDTIKDAGNRPEQVNPL